MGSGGHAKWKRRERKYIRQHGCPPPKSFYEPRMNYLMKHNQKTLEGIRKTALPHKRSLISRISDSVNMGLAAAAISISVSSTKLPIAMPVAQQIAYVQDIEQTTTSSNYNQRTLVYHIPTLRYEPTCPLEILELDNKEKCFSIATYQRREISEMDVLELSEAIQKTDKFCDRICISREDAYHQDKQDQRLAYSYHLDLFVALQQAHLEKTGDFFGKQSLKNN